MPHDPDLGDILADELVPVSETKEVRVTLGMPRPMTAGDPESDWECPVRVEGYGTLVPIAGVGPVTALLNASSLIHKLLHPNREPATAVGVERDEDDSVKGQR